jgi:putative sugar O-methyltransferase
MKLTSFLMRFPKIGNLRFKFKFDAESKIFIERVQYLKYIYGDGEKGDSRPVWREKHTKGINHKNFRSDNSFIWQKRKYKVKTIINSFKRALELDKRDLFSILSEKNDFGVECYTIEGRSVSRDLLDSVLEINFLWRNLSSLPNIVLDVGAGYGRFARRSIEGKFSRFVICIDAIPISTAVSEIYLRDLVEEKKIYIALFNDPLEQYKCKIDLAVNIHSFSEMSINEVEFWIKRINKLEIPYIFIVPNSDRLALNTGEDFYHILLKYNYEIIIKENKYGHNDSDKEYYYPSTYFLLHKISD